LLAAPNRSACLLLLTKPHRDRCIRRAPTRGWKALLAVCKGCPHASQAADGRVYRPRNPHAQLGTTLRALIAGENSGCWLAPDGQNYEVITQLPRANRTAIEDIANLNIALWATVQGRPAGAALGISN
jgi:hypothetical protein